MLMPVVQLHMVTRESTLKTPEKIKDASTFIEHLPNLEHESTARIITLYVSEQKKIGLWPGDDAFSPWVSHLWAVTLQIPLSEVLRLERWTP